MSTTRSRRERRAKSQKIASEAERITDIYLKNPNAALQSCYQAFGKEKFQNALQMHLANHVVETAVKLAVKKCMEV